jgi:hypothetical protein
MRLITPLGDGQYWLDVLYAVVRLPVNVCTFVVVVGCGVVSWVG